MASGTSSVVISLVCQLVDTHPPAHLISHRGLHRGQTSVAHLVYIMNVLDLATVDLFEYDLTQAKGIR
jgi:hypothetical protein